MLTVTLPSGKVYTFAARNAARAHALAAKTGGFVTGGTAAQRSGADDGYDAQRDADLLSGRRSAERYARYGRNLRMR